MFVLPIPDIDGGAAFAGAIPIQTKPAITAVLNTRVRIDFASLTKVTVLCSFQRPSPEGPQCDGAPIRCWTFGQNGTLGNLIDHPLPAVLGLFQGLPRGISNVLLDVMLGHRKLYGLTRTRQRFRRLEVGNCRRRGPVPRR